MRAALSLLLGVVLVAGFALGLRWREITGWCYDVTAELAYYAGRLLAAVGAGAVVWGIVKLLT